MRILVCGGRDYAVITTIKERNVDGVVVGSRPLKDLGYRQYYRVSRILDKLAAKHSKHFKENDNWLPTDIVIISGMAKGTDTAAADWAIKSFAQLEEYPPDWSRYGKSAGYIRNKQMLEEGKPDLVVAFPGGKGTAMMVDLAKKAGIPVEIIENIDEDILYALTI